MGGEGPLRSCVACRSRKEQARLIRIARRPDGSVSIDVGNRRGPGRGAYICPNPTCVEQAWASGKLSRALGVGVLPDGLRTDLLASAEGS